MWDRENKKREQFLLPIKINAKKQHIDLSVYADDNNEYSSCDQLDWIYILNKDIKYLKDYSYICCFFCCSTLLYLCAQVGLEIIWSNF